MGCTSAMKPAAATQILPYCSDAATQRLHEVVVPNRQQLKGIGHCICCNLTFCSGPQRSSENGSNGAQGIRHLRLGKIPFGISPQKPLDEKQEKQAYQRELHTVTVGACSYIEHQSVKPLHAVLFALRQE